MHLNTTWLVAVLFSVACAPATALDDPSDTDMEEPGDVDTGDQADRDDRDDTDTGSVDDTGTSSCLNSDDGASSGRGQYTVGTMELAPGNDGATVYYPAELEDSPCTFAVIGWGNGTSSTGGDAYPVYFDRLASHGFVVAVAHTNFALNGPVLLDTAAQVLALNDDPDSVFYGKLRTGYGMMGKSQGAIAAARDVETDPNAIAAVMVAGSGGTLTKPALFATGDDDFLQGGTLNGYEAASGEAVYAEAAGGVGHLALDEYAGTAELATSFMRCHLQDDANACTYVACVDCQVEAWGDYRVK